MTVAVMQNDTRDVNGVAAEVSATLGRTWWRSPALCAGGTHAMARRTHCGAGDALGRNRREKLVMRGLFVRRTPADFFQSLVLSNPVRFLNASLGNYTLEDCT